MGFLVHFLTSGIHGLNLKVVCVFASALQASVLALPALAGQYPPSVHVRLSRGHTCLCFSTLCNKGLSVFIFNLSTTFLS